MRPEPRTARISSGEMAFLDAGEGPAVVLLHGFPTSSHLWREFLPLLASRFRTIAPDLIGYGASTKAPGTDLSIRAQAGYVRELLAGLGIEGGIAAVGHDIGGGVAQLLAFEGVAACLVLIDAVTLDSWPIEGVRMLQGHDEEDATAEFAGNVVRLALELGMSKRSPSEDLARAYVEPFTGPGGPAALVRAARGIDGEGLTGTEDRLAAVGERLLVLWGEDDPYQDVDLAVRLSDLVPGSTVATLPGCSHFLPEDAPETIGPILYEWLRVRFAGEGHRHGRGPAEASFDRPVPRDDS